jgi:hypothetical protein
MWEASRSVIDGMMERLGETAGLVAGDQKRERAHPVWTKGGKFKDSSCGVRIPPVKADRGVGDGFRSPTTIGRVGLGGKRERPSLGDMVRLGWRSEGPPVSRGESEVEECKRQSTGNGKRSGPMRIAHDSGACGRSGSAE